MYTVPYMVHGVSHEVDRQSEFGCAIMFAVRKNLAGCAQHEVELNHRWHIISPGPGNGNGNGSKILGQGFCGGFAVIQFFA